MRKFRYLRTIIMAGILPVAALAITALLPTSAATASLVPARHDVPRPIAVHAATRVFAIPAHLGAQARAADRVTTGPGGSKLDAPAAGCAWYTIVGEDTWGGHTYAQEDIQLLVSVLGQYNSSGGYCGLASDHDCAEPTDNTYTGGLLIFNTWIADGGAPHTRQDRFSVKAGNTVCSYSGSFKAAHSAETSAEYADAFGNVVGIAGTGGGL